MATCTATSTVGQTVSSFQPVTCHCESRDIFSSHAQHEAAATAAAEPPWTAARCLRHLRPIFSHLAALRRQRTWQRDCVTVGVAAKRPCSLPEKDDLARKRVRYTYSLKGTKRRKQTVAATITATAASSRGAHVVVSGTSGSPEQGKVDNDRASQKPSRKRSRLAPLERRIGRYVAPGEVLVATPVFYRARKQQQSGPPPPPLSLPPRHCSRDNASASACADIRLRTKRLSSSASYRGYYDCHACTGALWRYGPKTASSNKAPSMDDAWLRFHRTTPPVLRQLYESVFRAIDALLKATAGAQGTATGMPRSLLAACLRKVPQYMALCEEEAIRDAEERGVTRLSRPDTSFDVYSDLESLGSGSGAGGWKHLRTVVRAHGIDAIKAACVDGLLHEAFVRLLVRRCVELQAYVEAEELLEVLVDSSMRSSNDSDRCTKPGSVDSTFGQTTGGPACLQDLLQYAEDTGRTRLLLVTLDRRLQSGQLPVAWLSTHAFDSIWGRVFDNLSTSQALGHGNSALVGFLTTVVTRLVLAQPADDLPDVGSLPYSGHESDDASSSPSRATAMPPSSSSFHTLISILSSITAISLLQAEAASDHGRQPPLLSSELTDSDNPASQCASAVLLTCLADTTKPQQQKRRRGRSSKTIGNDDNDDVKASVGTRAAIRRFLLALAHFTVNGGGAGQDLCAQVAEDVGEARRRLLYDAAVGFAASVAESCGRGTAFAEASATSSPACLYLTRLCMRMAGQLGEACFAAGPGDALLQRMQADGAFLLASRTNDLRDLAFAERLAGPPKTTPQKETAPPTALFAGYRWEEGISEWVISAPELVPQPTKHGRRQGSRKSEPIAVGRYEPVGVPSGKARRPRRSLLEPLPSASFLHTRVQGQSVQKAPPQKRQRQRQAVATTLLGLVSDGEDDDDNGDKDNDDDELAVWAVCTVRRSPLQRLDSNAVPRPQLGKGQHEQDRLEKRASTGRVSMSVCLPMRLGNIDVDYVEDDTTSDDELC